MQIYYQLRGELLALKAVPLKAPVPCFAELSRLRREARSSSRAMDDGPGTRSSSAQIAMSAFPKCVFESGCKIT